jgi:hypothetical protein
MRGHIAADAHIVGADEAHEVAASEAIDTRDDGNTCRESARDGIIDSIYVYGHQHECIESLAQRIVDERDLLSDIIGFLRHVVDDTGAQACRRALGAQTRSSVRRIGAVLGENGQAHQTLFQEQTLHYVRE